MSMLLSAAVAAAVLEYVGIDAAAGPSVVRTKFSLPLDEESCGVVSSNAYDAFSREDAAYNDDSSVVYSRYGSRIRSKRSLCGREDQMAGSAEHAVIQLLTLLKLC